MESITNTIVKAIPETITAGAQSVLGIVALSIVILSIIAILFFKNSSERTKIFIFVTLFIGIGMFIYAVVLQKQSEGHGNLDDEPITLNGSLNRNENNTHKINLVAGNIIEIKPKLVSVDSLYFDMVLYSSEDSAKRCGIARWKGSSLGACPRIEVVARNSWFESVFSLI